jgi:hypothetical protein
MAISVVNISSGGTSASGISQVITGVTVPAGALIFLTVNTAGGTNNVAITVTDSAGNPYTRIINQNISGLSNNIATFYSSNVAGLSGGTITMTGNVSWSRVTWSIVYATGIANAVLDTNVTATIHVTSNSRPFYTLTSGTPTVAGELFFCSYGINTSTIGNFPLDTGNGWTQPPFSAGSGGGNCTGMGAQVNAGTGTKISQPGNNFGFSQSVAGLIVGFRPGVPSPDGWVLPASEPVGFDERSAAAAEIAGLGTGGWWIPFVPTTVPTIPLPQPSEPIGFDERIDAQAEIAGLGTGVFWNPITPPTIPVVAPLPSWEIAQPRLEEAAADLEAQAAVIADASSGPIYAGSPNAGLPRVSQVSPEVASDDTPSARVSQLSPEIAAADTPSVRVSQLVPEIAADDVPGARVSQLVPEIAHADIPGARVSGMWLEIATAKYYQPPPPQIFPSMPGLTFPVTITPRTLNLRQAPHPSGREVRLQAGSLPVWQFTLDFALLRGTPGFTEYAEMLGFFFAQLGSQRAFLFRLPQDCEVTDQDFTITNGRSVFGPLVRTYAGSTEPVGYVDTTQPFALYQDGDLVDSSDYFILRDAPGDQKIKFRDTPPAGKTLSVDMSFFYVCRFADDTIDVEEFMNRLYSLASVKLIAPRPRRSAAGSIFGYVTN